MENYEQLGQLEVKWATPPSKKLSLSSQVLLFSYTELKVGNDELKSPKAYSVSIASDEKDCYHLSSHKNFMQLEYL